jgi:hypothetical protein
MKRTASAVGLAATVLLAPLAVAGAATAAPHYANCAAAHAAGVSNIHRGDPAYRPALDEDHDGVACEEPTGGSSGHGKPVSHPSTGTNEGSDDPDTSTGSDEPATSDDSSGSGTSTGSSTSSSSSGSTSSSADQVAVVPQGGAETGDGSTEGHPVWWTAGVLVASAAGLGALAAVRRRRIAARR